MSKYSLLFHLRNLAPETPICLPDPQDGHVALRMRISDIKHLLNQQERDHVQLEGNLAQGEYRTPRVLITRLRDAPQS